MSNLIDRYDSLFEPQTSRGVCGVGGSGSTSSSTTKTIPPGVQPLISQSAGLEGSLGQQSAAGLFSQLGANPEQIAQLNPQEREMINSLVSQGGANNPLMTGAEDELSQLTSGPIGSSPATQAAMQSYNTNAVPQVQQALSMSGSGRGGGDAEALTSSREAAYAPLVQQEIANREAAVNQYSSLAGEQSNLSQTGLSAAQMKQQTQQAGYDAAYQDLLRRYGLEQTAALGPIQQVLGQLIGQNQNISSSSTPSTLDQILQGSDVAASLVGGAAPWLPK